MTQKNRSKSLITVSDIHDGGVTAICTEEPYISEADTVWKPNKVQKMFFGVWNECIDEISQKPRALIVNGEPIDGINKKQYGSQTWSMNLNDQLTDAAKLIKMIKSDLYFVNRGSAYHTQVEGTNQDEAFARLIRADRYRGFETDNPISLERGLTDYYCWLKAHGKIISITHHVGFSKIEMYRTTAMARELMLMKLQSDRQWKADIIIRSHVHYHVLVGFRHTKGFTTPAWKLADGHLYKSGLGGTSIDVGMVETIIETNGIVTVRPILTETNFKPYIREI